MGIYDRDYYQEEPVRPFRPWDNHSMVSILIFACAGFFLANYIFTPPGKDEFIGELSDSLALRPADMTQPVYWWRFFSYGFTHHGIFHILTNMLSLYFLGRGVEDRLGKWEFFRFYMVTIVVCGIVWCALHGENYSLVGASGAITGVSMLFCFFYPQAEIRLMFAIPLKAWMLGVFIIISNLFRPNMMGIQGMENVAYDVHLVGAAMAAGYHFAGLNFGFFGSIWGSFRKERKIQKSGLKVHEPEAEQKPNRDERSEEELDRILAKIHEQGEESLTRKERKFMQNYSKKIRKERE
ncbi:MAG: rhomboid family intramembrane serine protease [Planctomycetota bacterium]